MIVIIFLSCVLCLCLIWKCNINKISLELPVLPEWYPIIGHGYKLLGSDVEMLKTLFQAADVTNKMGGVSIAYFGPKKTYLVSDPDDIVTIMNSCFQKHFLFDFLKPIIGDGLLTADVPTWKKNRKLLSPAFNQQVFDSFIEIFNSQAEKLVDQFDKEVGKPFDQEVLLRVNTLETICITSLGGYGKESEYNQLISNYLNSLLILINLVNTRIQKFWFHNNFLYSFSNLRKQQDIHLKHVSTLSKLIIKKKKAERSMSLGSPNKSGKFKPFLDHILDLCEETKCLSEEQVLCETETIIAAGHETIATTLTLTLAVLGSHPDVQEKAYKEILHVLGDNKTVTKEDLSQLVYVDAVLKEAQRLYVISTVFPRHLDTDVQLKNYTLKAGSDCVTFLCSLHRHSMWGSDADHFRPERWLDRDSLPDPKYYGAFGLGRRNCIGKAYAVMSMKIILSHMIRKYHISSDISNLVMKMQTLIRPHDGHHITLHYRNQA